jgi:hypothetical protein
MRKKQNTGRSIAQSIHRIYASGLFVTAGFIIGFDSETESAAEAMIELIEEAAIPVCMVGLLYALPHTQLERRLEKEGRLFPHPERNDLKTADQCTMGLIAAPFVLSIIPSTNFCFRHRAQINLSSISARAPLIPVKDATDFGSS